MIYCVTISRFFDKELTQSLECIFSQSLLPEKIILVVSKISDAERDELLLTIPPDLMGRMAFAFNRDCSLYNAMNIGLSLVPAYSHCIFINAGDYFYDRHTVSLMQKYQEAYPGVSIAFSTIQQFENQSFLRYSKPSRHSLFVRLFTWFIPEALPPHQGFLYYKVPNSPYFNESNSISADSRWIHSIIKNSSVEYSDHVVSRFILGGISNSLSFKKLLSLISPFSFVGLIRILLLLFPQEFRFRFSALVRGYKRLA